MEKLFGTDGVRGIPGKPPLTREMVRAIAANAARLLFERGRARVNGRGPFILIGRDTRASGPDLTRSLCAGFADAGVTAVDLGVAPTPAVSYLTPKLHGIGGAVISASHNPAEFNGIKFFDADGFKMDPETESRVEHEVATGGQGVHSAPAGAAAKPENGAAHAALYIDFLRSTFPATLDLTGMTLIVDCANGAASAFAPKLLESLGARVIALSCAPNGRNINANCGALFPQNMQKAVVKHKADAGVCFDGDADRAIFADEKGALLDGDSIICLGARRLRRAGLLRNDKVVLTVMSNFGLIKSLEDQGIGVVSVPVGDRNVTEAIEKDNLSIGGENSGHVIFRRFAVTGDGMLTALQTLAALVESKEPLSETRKTFRPVPQVLENLHCENKPPLDTLPKLQALIARCEKQLRGEGRIFLRYSGTEPLLRIMVEGPSRAQVHAMAKGLAQAFLAETGQKSVKSL
jgi:phosphoglucosamine mutase